jgi:hypothetical protein
MSTTLRRFALAGLITAAACASGSGGTRGSTTTAVRPPELLTRSRPDLVPPRTVSTSGRPSTVVEFSVVVNVDGTPDMNTLKISGPGAAENRSAVTSWVEGLRFRPGQQAGEPVPAMFKMGFQAMTVVRRVPR